MIIIIIPDEEITSEACLHYKNCLKWTQFSDDHLLENILRFTSARLCLVMGAPSSRVGGKAANFSMQFW
jgi:hypothetical protein